MYNCVLADFLEYEIEEESVDLCITDPPYWTLDEYREVGTTTRLGGHSDPSKREGWFNTIDSQELFEAMSKIYTCMKPNTHTYIMCDGKCLKYVLGYADELYNYVKPLVWVKNTLGMGYHYRGKHEYIVMCEKGKRKLNDLAMADVFNYDVVRKQYPTQKPVHLMMDLIKQSSQEGELVFDPFMGSGTTGEAAIKLKRRFLGTDISKEAVSLTEKRLLNIGKVKTLI